MSIATIISGDPIARAMLVKRYLDITVCSLLDPKIVKIGLDWEDLQKG